VYSAVLSDAIKHAYVQDLTHVLSPLYRFRCFRTESYQYLFDLAVGMKQINIEPDAVPSDECSIRFRACEKKVDKEID